MSPGAADAWLAASRPDLGGLRPAELAAYGEDGSRWRCRCSSGEIGGEPETMADIVSGGRVGGFVVFTDGDGLRHAVRPGAVLTLSDGDDMGEITMMQMPGNRAVLIRRRLDEVLEWFG